ncbi:MAG: AraC family transcriptional regulator [Clostridia bacterium]|nr:AraC family transcriptional regulator [Clostridia bacterium]
MQSLSSFMNTIRFNFLYIDKYSFGRTWTYPESAIPYNMLRYIIDGSAEFVVDGETVIVRKGQVSYIPEGCWLSCKALEDTFAFYSIRFTTSVFYEGANFLREYYNFPLVMDVSEGIEPYFSDIYKWVRTDKKSKSFHVRGSLDTLIASLIDILNSDEPDDVKAEINGLEYNLEQIRKRVKKSTVQTDPRIQTVIDYIMLNPTEEYTSDKLSGMAEVAETTFRRLFKEATGKTATEFIRQVRLTTAARLLLVSNDPVNCIAHDVGFEDANHFTRVFKQAFGMTPGRYRKMSQE